MRKKKAEIIYSDRIMPNTKSRAINGYIYIFHLVCWRGVFGENLLVSMLGVLQHAPEGTTGVLRTVCLPGNQSRSHRAGRHLKYPTSHVDARFSQSSFYVCMASARTSISCKLHC